MKTSPMRYEDGVRRQPERGRLRTIASHPWQFALLAVGALLLALSGVVAVRLRHPTPSASGTQASAPTPVEIDLGTVPQRSRAEKVISLKNRTDSPVEVATLRTTCPCLTVEINERIIPPSGEATARVVLDLRDEPNFTGSLGIEVTGAAAGGKVGLLARVKAKVVSGAPKGESNHGK